MIGHHLVRVGALGHVGRFRALDAVCYPRRSDVIVRTARGLEIGEVLSSPEAEAAELPDDGAILRGMTVEDHLLQARLEKHRQSALEACSALLAERGLAATLLDVEHLFDGRRLFFYFLGEVPDEVEQLTSELADTYEVKAELRQFATALAEGCGPDCGTQAASGGGCQTCSGCSVAGACGVGKK